MANKTTPGPLAPPVHVTAAPTGAGTLSAAAFPRIALPAQLLGAGALSASTALPTFTANKYYTAYCPDCSVGPDHMHDTAIFLTVADRDLWALTHTENTGHNTSLREIVYTGSIPENPPPS